MVYIIRCKHAHMASEVANKCNININKAIIVSDFFTVIKMKEKLKDIRGEVEFCIRYDDGYILSRIKK